MNILDKVDPIKREYIDAFISDGTITNVKPNKFIFKSNKSITFTRVENGYNFPYNNFLLARSDPLEFIQFIKSDLLFQIDHLENIQKILWGMIIHDNIPEIFHNILNISHEGIRDIYNTGHNFIDHLLKGQKPSALLIKAIKVSKKSSLKVPCKSIYSINFNKHSDSMNVLDNRQAIPPIHLFKPNNFHEQLEYVDFLKKWAKFD